MVAGVFWVAGDMMDNSSSESESRERMLFFRLAEVLVAVVAGGFAEEP